MNIANTKIQKPLKLLYKITKSVGDQLFITNY